MPRYQSSPVPRLARLRESSSSEESCCWAPFCSSSMSSCSGDTWSSLLTKSVGSISMSSSWLSPGLSALPLDPGLWISCWTPDVIASGPAVFSSHFGSSPAFECACSWLDSSSRCTEPSPSCTGSEFIRDLK